MCASVSKSASIGSDLTKGAIWRTLIVFAIPIILTSVIQQIYALTDLVVIGQFVGKEGTVGVSTGGEIADYVAPVATAFSGSGQIIISQLMGARKKDRAKRTMGTLFTISFLVAVLISVITIIFCVPILRLLNCPAEAMRQAVNYMIITALGYPFIFGYNAVVGVLRGMGEAKRPLLFIVIAAVINIFTDLLFVVIIPLEAAGTAIATVASQIGAFAASFLFLYKHSEHFGFKLEADFFRIDWQAAKLIIKLSIPQFVRTTMVRFSMIWANAGVNSYGIIFSSTNSIGNKIQKFLDVFMQGVDVASATVIGQNLAARQIKRVRRTVWVTLAFTSTVAVIAIALSCLIPRPMFSIFTGDRDVIELGSVYLKIMCFHFIFSAFVGAFQSLVTGCGFVELGFAIGVIDGVLCKIGLSLIFLNVLNAGEYSYWWGTAFSRVLPGLLCFGYYISGSWKTRKLLADQI